MCSFNTLDELTESLLEDGFPKRDVGVAAELALKIRYLDRMIFSKEDEPIITFDTGEYSGLACYIDPDAEEKPDSYVIFVYKLSRKLRWVKRRIESHMGFFWLIKGSVLKSIFRQRCTREECIICLAAHEVRHRVQKLRKIRKFGDQGVDSCEEQTLKAVIRTVDRRFRWLRKRLKRKRIPAEYIKKRHPRKNLTRKL